MFGDHSWQWPTLWLISIAPSNTLSRSIPSNIVPKVTSDGNGSSASGYSGHGPNTGLAVALGGIFAAGVVYSIIGLIVMATGSAWVERLMPPVVTGAVVAVIGLNLAPVAVKGVRHEKPSVDCALPRLLSALVAV
jgi:xanthine/uracil permease